MSTRWCPRGFLSTAGSVMGRIAATMFVFIAINSRASAVQSLTAAAFPDEGGAADSPARAIEALGALPLSFEENRGQTDTRVRFLTRGAGYALFLTAEEAVMVLRQPGSDETAAREARSGDGPEVGQGAVLRMRLVGADPEAEVSGLDGLPGRSNYLTGPDPGRWTRGVPHYARVRYAEVYPGVDLIFRGNQRRLEYDFTIAPNADPSRIRLTFAGVDGMTLDEDGSLVLHTSAGEVVQRAPFAYQESGEGAREVAVRYELAGDDQVTFALGPYDQEERLIIDPIVELAYSTYFGGSALDWASDVVVDSDGSAYVAGQTQSFDDFPVFAQAGYCAAPNPAPGTGGAVVFKLNPDGSLCYSTYLPFGFHNPSGIAVDSTGRVAVAVRAGVSSSLPHNLADNPVQSTVGIYDHVAVLQLTADGCNFAYATYLSGSYGSVPGGIAIGADDDIYVTGRADGTSKSTNFLSPHSSEVFPFRGITDAFVVKLDPDAPLGTSSLSYFTFLGGTSNEFAARIAVDHLGCAVVTGSTNSVGGFVHPFPVTHDHGYTGGDSFVAKFDPSLSGSASLVFSIRLSGSGACYPAVDSSGNVYVAGTAANDTFFLGAPGFDKTMSWVDAFVVKLTADGTQMPYATYLGGSSAEYGKDIAVGPDGTVFVTGFTTSTDFPVLDAFQATRHATQDCFVTALAPDLSSLVYSTYLGSGIYYDQPTGIDVDSQGSAYVTGNTGTGGHHPFPTEGEHIPFPTGQGSSEMFLTKFKPALGSDDEPPEVAIVTPPDQSITGSITTPITAVIVDESTTTVSSTPTGLVGSLPAGGGTVSGTLPLDSEGANLLTVHAFDEAGNTGGSSVTVYRDTVPPLLGVSPAEGSIVGLGPVTLGLTISDQTQTVVTVDAAPAGTILVAGGAVYGTADGNLSGQQALSEGPNAFVVDATDAAGNATTVTRTIVLDSEAPIVTIDEPLDGTIFGATPVCLVATVDDLTATTVGGHLSGTLPPGGGIVPGTADLLEGWNTLTVTATDEAGNTAGDSVDVLLDTTPPTVAIESPLGGALVRGTIDYDAVAGDASPGSGVVSVELQVDGGTHEDFGIGPYESVLDTKTIADGWHTLTAIATDGVGLTATDEIWVRVDNTPPLISIIDPASGALLAGDIQFTAFAEDAESGLATVEMRSGGAVPSITDGSTTYDTPVASDVLTSIDGAPAADGAWTLWARAVDAAGNEADSEIEVMLDNSAPDKTIVSPADGARVSGVVPIEVVVDDPNLDFFELYVDGMLAATGTASPFLLDYDTTQRTDGSMTIALVAFDTLGNSSSCVIVVTVDNGGCAEMHPETLNLKSKGQDRSITVKVCGFGLETLLPTEDAYLRLCVPGGSPVPSTVGFAGDDHLQNVEPSGFAELLLKFDRQELIASIRAGRQSGVITGDRVVLTLKAGDNVLGSDDMRLVGE